MIGVILNFLDHILCSAPVVRDLTRVRGLLVRVSDGGRISFSERSMALDLLELRGRMARILRGIRSCSTCAVGHPLPNGRHPGGYCCGSATDNLFTEDQLAQLYASGTRPRHLRSAARVEAGCAFRGPGGCSLPPAHRPNTCASYLCGDLARELGLRGDLDRAEALAARIITLSNRAARARHERLLDGLLRADRRGEL